MCSRLPFKSTQKGKDMEWNQSYTFSTQSLIKPGYVEIQPYQINKTQKANSFFQLKGWARCMKLNEIVIFPFNSE